MEIPKKFLKFGGLEAKTDQAKGEFGLTILQKNLHISIFSLYFFELVSFHIFQNFSQSRYDFKKIVNNIIIAKSNNRCIGININGYYHI